jgi:hypothetical protein
VTRLPNSFVNVRVQKKKLLRVITGSQEFVIKTIVLDGIGAHDQVDLVGDIIILVRVHDWRWRLDGRYKVRPPKLAPLPGQKKMGHVKGEIYIAEVTRVTPALLFFFVVAGGRLQGSEKCSQASPIRHL